MWRDDSVFILESTVTGDETMVHDYNDISKKEALENCCIGTSLLIICREFMTLFPCKTIFLNFDIDENRNLYYIAQKSDKKDVRHLKYL